MFVSYHKVFHRHQFTFIITYSSEYHVTFVRLGPERATEKVSRNEGNCKQ